MGLPGKTLLSVDELIDRWKHWRCDYASLHSYAQRDLLVFSTYLRDIGSHRRVRHEGEQEITQEVRTIQFRRPDAVIRRLFYLDADDSRRILEAKPAEQVAVHALYWSTGRVKKHATYHVPARYFTRRDLLVTREECNRFERHHGLTGISGLARKFAYWINDPSRIATLAKLGSAVVIVATGAWGVFKWYAS